VDLIALVQPKVQPKCLGVHHRIQKDGHNVGYLSTEPICAPQLFWVFTLPSSGERDVVQT